MVLMNCNDPGLSSILSIVKNILNIIWIVGPIVAMIALIIAITSMINNPDDKKIPNKIKNSLIALVVLFLIPAIINATMYMIGESSKISACWNSASGKISSYSSYIDPNTGKRRGIIINPGDYEGGNPKEDTSSGTDFTPNGELAERIASSAEYYAWPEGTPKSKYCRFNGGGGTPQFMADYRKFWPNFKNSSDKSVAAGTCCCHFARTCVVKGLGKKFSFTLLPSNSSRDEPLRRNMEKLGFVRITFDGNYSTLKRGDVLYYRNKGSGGHVWIFLGNHKAAEAAHGSGYGGRITKVGSSKLNINTKSVYYIFRAAK